MSTLKQQMATVPGLLTDELVSGKAEEPVFEAVVGPCALMEGDRPADLPRGLETCFNDGDAVTGWLLEWFSPFNELTDVQRDIIAGYETIHKAGPGECLVKQGTRDDRCLYLVEGRLALEGAAGERMVVQAGTRRSRLPISVLAPHVYNVTAETDVSVVVFSQALLRRIIEVTTTYTSVGSHRDAAAATAAISSSAQEVYLRPVFSRDLKPG